MSDTTTTIIVKDIIQSKIAFDAEDGNKVFDEILKKSRENYDVIYLNFKGIDLINTAFLNNAVGKLFDTQLFNLKENKVLIQNMDSNKLELLKETISVARKKYM